MTANRANLPCLDTWNSCPFCFQLYFVRSFCSCLKEMTSVTLPLQKQACFRYSEETFKSPIKGTVVILINNLVYNVVCANNVICIEGTPSTSIVKILCNCSSQRCRNRHSTAVAVISEPCAKI